MAASPSHGFPPVSALIPRETTGKLQQLVATRGIRMTRQTPVILQVMDAAERVIWTWIRSSPSGKENRCGRSPGYRLPHD